MKNQFYMGILILGFSFQACDSEKSNKEVPMTVKEAFGSRFPEAKNVEWGRENEEEWEAEFSLEGHEYSSNFSNSGDWLETETEVAIDEIPADIINLLNQEFTDYDLEFSERVESPEGIAYEFGIEVDEDEYEVLIDSRGKIEKKIENESDED
ncbi:PepSY-like domain-containing protein [Algoriphagus sp. PAP.12]|uniref:PepSY-like domain-containing protein n=1 Tax=Algoriphagus sp. PAP.12 TaxID=2996678 RepID=UPI00227D5D21|nr:PepSY-like domain-containing protein [Algoriphagus sp. PAP.12]